MLLRGSGRWDGPWDAFWDGFTGVFRRYWLHILFALYATMAVTTAVIGRWDLAAAEALVLLAWLVVILRAR